MTEETKDSKFSQRFLLDMKALQERFPTKHDLYTWMVNDGKLAVGKLLAIMCAPYYLS